MMLGMVALVKMRLWRVSESDHRCGTRRSRYSAFDWSSNNAGDADGFSYLIQAGYLFPGTAWEIAARYDHYEVSDSISAADEIGVAVNYYVDGHADKVTLDVAFITSDDLNTLGDTYAGYSPSYDSDAVLVRLHWQLAL